MALSGVVVVGGIGTYVVLENRKSQDAPVEVSAPAATNQAVKDESASTASDAVSGETEEVASSAEQTQATEQTQADEQSQTTEQTQATAQEQATSEPASPTADWIMPAFDLLRVEPDGSTVIAGRGQPNTSLKIMNGEEMIAETEIGSSGDFVVIFDEALNSGDYQLSLKVEDENGLFVTSQETAIVSVPEDESGQLLAMVQKPGEASRIITQPEAAPSETDTNSATKTEESASEKPADTAIETASDATTTAAPDEKAVDVAANDANEETRSAANTEAADTDATGAETIVADVKDAVVNATENVAETAEKVMEKASDSVAETAEKVMEKTEEAVETAQTAIETVVEKAVEETESTVAALTSDNTDTQADALAKQEQPAEEKMETKVEETLVEKPVVEKPKAPSENVRIEAVEVEGDKLFVAGSGTAGYQVRVFANDEEVGVANVDSNGRFIIEATKDLEVGQHQITAALEDKQTNQVILRAVVPFNRPEGQALAAVASRDDTNSMDKPVDSSETETAMAKEEPEVADTETVAKSATGTATGTGTGVQVASNAETQTATSATSETTPPATSEAVSNDASATMSKEDNMVKSDETMAPEETSTVADTATETAAAETVIAETVTDEAVAQEQETTVAASNDNQALEPKTIVQDELQPASSQSVIIRRGDTLWQIARRTYGAGVRYTTIYLANQQQIDNPDKIAPGQIFAVPEEALENAEQLHRQRLGVE